MFQAEQQSSGGGINANFDPEGDGILSVNFSSQDDCQYDPQSQKYKCWICHKKYVTRSGVLMHVKVKHEGQFSAYCEICGKGFQRKLHLIGHMAVHGLPMQYECSVCGQKYAHKTSLRSHEKVAHGLVY